MRAVLYFLLFLFFWTACTSNRQKVEAIPTVDLAQKLEEYHQQEAADSIIELYTSISGEYVPGDDSVASRVHFIYAFALKKRENYNLASSHYKKSLEYALNVYPTNHSKIGEIYNNLGNVYRALRKTDSAIFFFQKRLNVPQPNEQLAMTYNNIGELYRTDKNYDSAIHYFEKSIPLQNIEERHYPINNIGLTYARKGDYAKAHQYLNEALELRKSVLAGNDPNYYLISRTLNNQAYVAMLEEDTEKVLNYADLALSYPHQHNRTLFYSWYAKTQSLFDLDRLEEALAAAQEADRVLLERQQAIISQADKLFLVNETNYFSEIGFEIARKLNDLDQAFYFSERKKGNILQELRAEQDKELLGERVLKIRDIQNQLDTKSALIEYTFTEDSLYAFVITLNEAKLIPLASSEADSLAIRFIKDIQRLTGEYIESGHQLYQRIFEPLEAILGSRRRLTIIPDRNIHYAPLEALLYKEAPKPYKLNTAYLSKLPYLIKKYTVSYYVSASLAVEKRSKREPYDQGFVAFAPNFDGTKLKPLPYSEKAVQEIVRSFKSQNKKASLHKEPKKSTFVRYMASENSTQFLHIDTHGFANPGAEQGWLMFQDSSLYLNEILRLPSIQDKMDLAVLSACHSGDGVYKEGEGLLSVSWGFLSIGARNVIHSHWLASDESAAKTMEIFYDLVLKEGLSYSEALRQAKLRLISSKELHLAHPILWGCMSIQEVI